MSQRSKQLFSSQMSAALLYYIENRAIRVTTVFYPHLFDFFNLLCSCFRIQELCESRGGRPGLPVLMSLMVSVEVKQHWTMHTHWSQFVPNMSNPTSENIKLHNIIIIMLMLLFSELRSFVKIEVAALGSSSLISWMVSVDVKQHWNWKG